MIKKFDIEQLAGIFKPFCDLSIRLAWLRISTRMIVRHDNTGRAIAYGFGKDFARMNQASSERADGDDAFGYEAVGAIEREANEVFLLFVTNVAQLLDGFFGNVDNWALANFKLPPPQFKPRHDSRRFGRTKAFDNK